MQRQNAHTTMASVRRNSRRRWRIDEDLWRIVVVLATVAGVVALCLPVEGGLIAKRQAAVASEEIEEVVSTTVPTIAAEQQQPLETSTAAPTTRTVTFERDSEPSTKEIEFGYDSENREGSLEQASVSELRQVDPSEIAVTTEQPENDPTTVQPTTVSVVSSDDSGQKILENISPAEKKIPSKDDPAEEEIPIKNTTVVTTTLRTVVLSPRSNTKEGSDISAEEESEPAATTLASELATESVNSGLGSSEVKGSSAAESGSGQSDANLERQASAGEINDLRDSVNDSEPQHFELERYTSPSNFSLGGISLEENRAERKRFFVEQDAATTERPGDANGFWEATTTQEPLEPADSVTQMVVTETNEVSVAVPEGLDGRNHTIESNRTVRVNQKDVETIDYEVISNEVRNQTAKGKKGKFLDQFGATEDNDINGAAWALAGMRVIDRSAGKAGESTRESVEVVRDDNENVVANNTLKQLMDWAAIMQAADFANTSFVRPTSGEVDLKSELKDRRKYANKTIGELDAMSEENRVASVVTDVLPEASVEVTTVMPRANLIVDLSSTTVAADDGLEDFEFEDKKKVVAETTKRPEFTNFIQETTTTVSVQTQETSTTIRPTRNYEVSEDVDETEKFALPGRSTTIKSDINTSFEDMQVTTYSPASPIIKRIEATTEAVMPTTFESMKIPRRRFKTTTTTTTTTTQDPRSSVEESTQFITITSTTTTTTSSPTTTTESSDPLVNELSQKVDEKENSSPEIDTNSVNQTKSEIALTITTTASTTESTDPMVPQQSTVLPTVVEIRPAQVTTDRSQSTESSEEIKSSNQPVLVDDKSVYDTVPDTTRVPAPEPEPSPSAEPEPTAADVPSTTTRRSIDRQMTTTTELSEEESVTEEDYVEVNSSASVNSAKSPLDQNATEQVPPEAEPEEGGSGVVVAVVASLVSVIVVLLLIAAYLIFRKRQAQVSYGQRCRPVGLDAYSLDNVSVYNSVRRKGNTMRMSKRSYGNSAFEDPGLKTNPLTVAELANIIQNKTAIYDEFKEIPNVTARADEVPEGCEDKNRYANVVPLPETRVHLKRINEDEKTEYINANFVKGPKDSSNYYIACQAPMENTINDFWRMIWEQNSKVIIMATDLSENGVEKCAEYLPPSVVLDNNRTFGDFQLTLKNRENKEKYTISTVHLRNTQTNTWREIMHFWYQWPDTGVPIDESSIIAMLLEARSYSRLAPAEMADATVQNGITSIAEEDSQSQQDSSLGVGSNNVDSSNNNNVGTKTASDSAPPSSIMTNGTNTMDKHKSLQRTQGPITVHCSPGTGRTGTIIACDVALRAVEIPPRNVDIPHVVYYVRRGRASAVRTREQYELIYRVANVYATKLTGPTIET